MTDNNIVLAILCVIAGLLIGGSIAYAAFHQPEPKITLVDKPVLVGVPYNDSEVKADIAAVQATLDEDDLWEAEAVKLAESDWNNKKDLYNALLDLGVTDLDDKDDINRVVIKDTDVSTDTDDKDADVSQEVRVYYESSTGDNVRITLTIDTEIIENNVEDVTFSLA